MEPENKAQSKITQTYAEDMAKVIEDDKTGLVKKIIHGEEEHEALKMNLSPESKRNKFFLFTGLALILLALTAFSFFFFREDINTVDIQKQFTPLIFNDKSGFVEVAGFAKDKIAQTVFNTIQASKVKDGGVEGIYLTDNKKIVGLRDFISLIQASFVPTGDVFVSDNFLLGVVNNDDRPASAEAMAGKDFFILLKVRSVADVFDSLRQWENKMFFDLHGFFGVAIAPETKYLLTKNFADGIVQNKNARILYDAENKIVMMYVFADDTSVVIADSENAVREIMLRLAASQMKK